MDESSRADALSRSQRIALMREALMLVRGVDRRRVRTWVPEDGSLVLLQIEHESAGDSGGGV